MHKFETFMDLPKLLNHLVRHWAQALQILDVLFDVGYFRAKEPAQLQLPP